MNDVYVLSGINSRFGELWGVSPRELAKFVTGEALTGAGIEAGDIDALYVGNMLSGTLGGQEHLGAFFSEELGMNVPAFRVEGACASGGLAMHAGFHGISSGQYKNVLVLGIEKMTDHKPEEVAKALMGAGSESEREAGATFPALYAMMARVHMEKYGTTEEQMASVAVKNHYHASLNSHAHFKNTVTLEKVMKSPVVCSPLKLLDCSPITDGASAVILSSKPGKNRIRIVASDVSTDSLGLSERRDLASINSAVTAAKKAYSRAGVLPADIGLAEVHDCFTIAEIIAMEDLGFFGKGKAARAIYEGKTTIGKGRLAVNTSGGLKAAGHPVGATGVKQIVEIFQQLSGMAGKKQVEGAKIGLAHNIGGSGATAVIHILKKE